MVKTMINELEVYNQTRSLIGTNCKETPSSWLSFNAPCCPHVDPTHRFDKLKRGGLKLTNSAVVYHCFNCGYTAMWSAGRVLPKKFQDLLGWMGMDPDKINKLKMEIWRQKVDSPDNKSYYKPSVRKLEFKPWSLPINSISMETYLDGNLSKDDVDKINYLNGRGDFIVRNMSRFFTTSSRKDTMNRRIIIPFYWEDDIVGYVGRTIDKIDAKYFGHIPTDYIFNTEVIKKEHKFVIVTEGPFDAISINGIAMLGDKCSLSQASWINNLNKKIIVVPDNDGKESNLRKKAIENGWYVSMPEWKNGIKDCADSVKEFGQIYTLREIINSRRLEKDVK